MNSANVLEICITLVEQGFYEQAKVILEPMGCTMACFLKGRIYMNEASRTLTNIKVHAYANTQKMRHFKNCADKANFYFSEARANLDKLDRDYYEYVQRQLAQDCSTLRSEIEIAQTYFDAMKIIDDNDEDKSRVSIDSVTENIEKWNLNQMM